MWRSGFTLIEMMAVVVLLGLLAGAVVWSLADEAHRRSRANVIARIAQADRTARIAARRLGRPCVLRFDLDRQRIVRLAGRRDHGGAAGHAMQLPAEHRIERVVVLGGPLSGGSATRKFTAIGTKTGTVEVAYSTAGRSASYALRLVSRGRDGGTEPAESAPDGGRWLLFAGLTGQMVRDHDDHDVDKLVERFTAGWPDAH